MFIPVSLREGTGRQRGYSQLHLCPAGCQETGNEFPWAVCTKERGFRSHGEINRNQNIPNRNEVLVPREVRLDSGQCIPALCASASLPLSNK